MKMGQFRLGGEEEAVEGLRSNSDSKMQFLCLDIRDDASAGRHEAICR